MRGAGGIAVVSLAILGSGCGSGSAGTPNTCASPQTGSRLKAFVLRAEDGAWENLSRYGYWYDSLLATRCFFDHTADGALRCLPSPPLSIHFADAACSQRVASARACTDGPPRYALVPLSSTCAGADSITPAAVYSLGSGSVPAVLHYQQSVGGNLQCLESPNSEGLEVYPFVSELAPTEFVAATIELTTGSRIQTDRLVAEDGTRGGAGRAFDSNFGGECLVDLAADGEWRCLPVEAIIRRAGWAFADPSCTQGLVMQGWGSCAPDFRAKLASIEEPRICAVVAGVPRERYPPKRHVHQLGAASTPAQTFGKTYQTDNSVICEATPNADAAPFSEVRAELPPTEFLRASQKEIACGPMGASGRRLKAHYAASDDGVVLSAAAIWLDEELGEECFFQVAADDVIRCIPNRQRMAAVQYFADASCSRGLVAIDRCIEFPRGAPKFAVVDETGGACVAGMGLVDIRARVHALGATVAPSALYRYNLDQPAGCVPFDQAGVETFVMEFEFRELGSEVPPTTFVAGTIEMP